jgi:hypothetical protein
MKGVNPVGMSMPTQKQAYAQALTPASQQDAVAMPNAPTTSVSNWLHHWLLERFPSDFISQDSLPQLNTRFDNAAGTKAKDSTVLPNQKPLIEKTLANGVTVVASSDKAIQRLDTLLTRMSHKLGRPLVEHIRIVLDDTLGEISPRNGAGMQAVYQNTRDAGNGKIFQESLHINTQFLDYLARQPVGKAEAYLAAVLFHEQSHRDVLKAAEQQGTFHRISQSDEKNANERAEAGIAQFYPEHFSWLRQNYFGLFRQHFTEFYGGLPAASAEDLHVIKAGNQTYNQRYFAH